MARNGVAVVASKVAVAVVAVAVAVAVKSQQTAVEAEKKACLGMKIAVVAIGPAGVVVGSFPCSYSCLSVGKRGVGALKKRTV